MPQQDHVYDATLDCECYVRVLGPHATLSRAPACRRLAGSCCTTIPYMCEADALIEADIPSIHPSPVTKSWPRLGDCCDEDGVYVMMYADVVQGFRAFRVMCIP